MGPFNTWRVGQFAVKLQYFSRLPAHYKHEFELCLIEAPQRVVEKPRPPSDRSADAEETFFFDGRFNRGHFTMMHRKNYSTTMGHFANASLTAGILVLSMGGSTGKEVFPGPIQAPEWAVY